MFSDHRRYTTASEYEV